MLHPTNLPDCESILQRLLDFQERLLEYACQHNDIIQAEVEAEFGKEVADWLFANKPCVLQSLIPFSRQPRPDKDAVLADFRHDRRYPTGKDDPMFLFTLRVDNTSSPVRKFAKEWLVGYYKQFAEKDGFPALILPEVLIDPFNKQHWWQGFLAKNPKRYVCSVCDGTMNHGMTIEHYFPKAVYPTMSLHPHGLLPLCDKCNNDKGDSDLLAGGNITLLFLPYHRHVREATRLEFVIDGSGSEQIALESITPQAEVKARIDHLSKYFQVPKRWQDNIHEIAEIACSRLRAYVDALKDAGQAVDPNTLKAVIDKACDQLQKDWGTAHYAYPATEWLRWARDNKFDRLCAEVLAGP